MTEKSRAFNRPKRKPVSGPSSRLNVDNPIKGMHYRWVNDTADRIQRFLDAGYEVVEKGGQIAVGGPNAPDNVGNVVSRQVGAGVTAYLMATPQEWRDKDVAEQQSQINKTEDDMRRQGGEDGRYGQVEIKRN